MWLLKCECAGTSRHPQLLPRAPADSREHASSCEQPQVVPCHVRCTMQKSELSKTFQLCCLRTQKESHRLANGPSARL